MGRDIYIYSVNLQKIKEEKENIFDIYSKYTNKFQYHSSSYTEEYISNIIDKLNDPSQFSGKDLFYLIEILEYTNESLVKFGITDVFETYVTDEANAFMDIFIKHLPFNIQRTDDAFYYPLSKIWAHSFSTIMKKNISKFSCEFKLPNDDSVYLLVDSY